MKFDKIIVSWYHKNKRDLPWRATKNPYLIWVSEIILQQTRVNQGINYYLRFVSKYPTIKSLASANIDDLMKIWQGLGYYSRVRNMHLAAKTIVSDYSAQFPNLYTEIIKLKGIGEYTAAAIASFSFKLPYPVVDGNVYRLLSRFFGIYSPINTSKGKKIFYDLAYKHLNKIEPDTYNQAIMEFGALQCIPQNPSCKLCPLIKNCFAYSKNKVSELPVKNSKPKIKKRYFNYFIIIFKGKNTLIGLRKEKDIWNSLYEFPLIETSKVIDIKEFNKNLSIQKLVKDTNYSLISKSELIKHVLSHQHIYTTFYIIQTNKLNKYILDSYEQVSFNSLKRYAFPRLIDKYLKESYLSKYVE